MTCICILMIEDVGGGGEEGQRSAANWFVLLAECVRLGL